MTGENTEIDQRFPVSLRGSWFGLNRIFRERLADTPITPAQYTTLRNVCENEGGFLNQRVLSRLVVSNENNLTAILKKLERMGLVMRRRRGKDRRNNLILATPAGQSLFRKAQEIASELQREINSRFDDDESERLLDYLERCVCKLDQIESIG